MTTSTATADRPTVAPPERPSRLIPVSVIVRDHVPVSNRTISRWRNERGFPTPERYIAGKAYWRESEVIAWLETQNDEPHKVPGEGE